MENLKGAELEEAIKAYYSRVKKYTMNKKEVSLLVRNGVRHKFDLFCKGKLIGGVSGGTWKTTKSKGKNNNTGSQDRALAELLWISLYEGKERKRVFVVGNEGMYEGLKKLKGIGFPVSIRIHWFSSGRLNAGFTI